MKKRKTIILYFFLLSLFGIYSCSDEEYENSYSAENPPAFVRYYKYEYSFLSESNDDFYTFYNEESEWDAKNHKNLYEGNTHDIYIDARTEEGYSTWSQPKHTFTIDIAAADANYKASQDGDHKHPYTGKIILSSPPAHLHLCLNSWNQYGYYAQKTWQIESITNESGQSLADDPDWTNYTDNRMIFKKNIEFTFYPGKKRSATEIDLFGAYSTDNFLVTGTYTVKEDASKKVTLTVSFPKFTETFEVVASSYTSLTLKGTVKGKSGYMQLKPAKN